MRAISLAEIILCGPREFAPIRGVTHVVGCELYYPTARGWKRPWVLAFDSKRLIAFHEMVDAVKRIHRRLDEVADRSRRILNRSAR